MKIFFLLFSYIRGIFFFFIGLLTKATENKSFLILIFFGVSLFNGEFFANDYKVVNVDIYADGKPIDARNLALERGQTEAFIRFCNENNFDLDKIKIPENKQISSMLKDFEFIEEKMTSNNYRARVNFTFDKQKIKEWLSIQNFSENNKTINKEGYKSQKKQMTFIVPILIQANKTIIWQEYNHWFQELDKLINESDLTDNFVLPSAEIEDVELLTDELMAKGTYEDFKPILKRYNADKAIIAIVQTYIDKKNIVPNAILTFRNISVDGVYKSEKFFSFKDDPMLLNQLKIIGKYLLGIKSKEKIVAEPLNKIDKVIIDFDNLDDYNYIRSRLIEICQDDSLKIKKFNKNQVSGELKCIGIIGNIPALLSKVGINARNDRDKLLIKIAGTNE